MHGSKTSNSMFAGTASGELLPPYVVYRAENLWDTWTLGGPPGTHYNRSKSGWFDGSCFTDWFRSIALSYLRKLDGTKVVIEDNLSSHFSQEVLELCQLHNVKFVCLPANSTHMCQPLDVAFFSPLKMNWRQILSTWKTGGGRTSATVTKDKFPTLLQKLLDSMEENRKQNLISGFRKAGIMPLNPEEVLRRLPNEDQDAQDVRSTVGEVFVDHLKQLRYGDGEPQSKTRRKRLLVEPGKSISDANNSPAIESPPSTSTDNLPQPKVSKK